VVLNDYGYDAKPFLAKSSAAACRKISRLETLFKIIHHECPLTIPSYFNTVERPTRFYHPRRFVLPTFAHQNRFYPKTIRDWNNLPVELNNIQLFTSELLNTV